MISDKVGWASVGAEKSQPNDNSVAVWQVRRVLMGEGKVSTWWERHMAYNRLDRTRRILERLLTWPAAR